MDRYAESGLPLDKAGGYGIQERGGLLISHIEGDYFSVMGLPVSEVFRRLSAYEID
ncbi:MAG TPA: Maf family protein [Bacillota bacterium]|nr:Maf family protein [Bacillota bacterium]